MKVVTVEHVTRLWWKLASLTIDVELLKLANEDSKTLRERQQEERRVKLELQAALAPGRVFQ